MNISDSVKEIIGGPATLLIYGLVLAGLAIIAFGSDADFEQYKEFVGPDGIAFPLLGLLVARGYQAGKKAEAGPSTQSVAGQPPQA